jgi:ornithine cyclodeaminase/alanine dehydrogenase-like protein (mu-crystallin family)
VQLRVLSANEIRQCIDMPAAIGAMREAFGQLAAGEAQMPHRVALDVPKGVSLVMPAHLGRENAAAAKVVSVFESNVERHLPVIHAVVLVLDAETGQPRALMDGRRLTALRTGAVGGLAADLLARPDAAVATVFGARVQARTQIEALVDVRPIRELRILSKGGESAQALASECAQRYGIRALAVQDPQAAIQGADVIITATPSRSPLFSGADVAAGAHVTSVGAFTPQMCEVDADLVDRSKVYVDDQTACELEAGDLLQAIIARRWSWDRLHAELGDVVNGVRAGRESPAEITFFKSVGLAIQDVIVAERVLAQAEKEGLGQIVDL